MFVYIGYIHTYIGRKYKFAPVVQQLQMSTVKTGVCNIIQYNVINFNLFLGNSVI